MSHWLIEGFQLLIVACLGWVGGHSSTPVASRGESMANKVDAAAEVFANSLEAEGASAVELIELVDRSTGNQRAGVEQALVSGLEKRNIRIEKNARLQISGVVEVVDKEEDLGSPEESRLLQVKISFVLTDKKTSEKIREHSVLLQRISEIAMSSGIVLQDDGFTDVRELHQEARAQINAIRSALDHPQKPAAPIGYVIAGKGRTEIKANADSQVSVEIGVASAISGAPGDIELVPRGPRANSAFPLVPIGKGEMYGVTIHNRSKREIAVGLQIDGLSQFTFSQDRNPETGGPRFSHWIVAPESSFTIGGWHVTSDPKAKEHLKRFLVTSYGEGASKVIPSRDPEKLGLISVSISNCVAPGLAGGVGGRGQDAETGFGPGMELQQTIVQRQIQPPSDIISIRYLVADE